MFTMGFTHIDKKEGGIEGYWMIEITKGVYFSLTDILNEKQFFSQGDECNEFLDQFDRLGLPDFLDWFYANEYDLSFKDETIENIKKAFERLGLELNPGILIGKQWENQLDLSGKWPIVDNGTIIDIVDGDNYSEITGEIYRDLVLNDNDSLSMKE
jgi:hypothetical protein